MKLHEIFNISDLEDQIGVCVIENAFDGIVEGVDYTLENVPACHDDVTRTVIGEASKKNWQDKSYRDKTNKARAEAHAKCTSWGQTDEGKRSIADYHRKTQNRPWKAKRFQSGKECLERWVNLRYYYSEWLKHDKPSPYRFSKIMNQKSAYYFETVIKYFYEHGDPSSDAEYLLWETNNVI
ncbi:hypothetical protein VPHD482_0114 [Vibrio phage D482]|uniref:Uncharacterized protein n=1 Tax=Vibrio phage V09 TaxID=2724327 RepID=A0A6H0X971_9CAUD|nr:hypothetical protein COHAPHLL_00094 [Vibrio phage V09]